MKSLILTILLSAFAFSSTSIYVSHNNKLSKVSPKALSDLYLKKSNTINGIKVTPIDSQNKKLFKEFYRNILKKTPKQLHAYWIKEMYRGTRKPPKKLSAKAIKKAMNKVKKNRTPIIAYAKNPKTGHILFTIK